MEIIIIAALAENFVIGRNNKLPWHYKEDFLHFKQLTTGHTVLMGRKTFDSIGKALPNRKNIVVTRNNTIIQELQDQGAYVVHDIAEGIKLAEDSYKESKLFIIGGSEIYKQALEIADTMELTLVHKSVEGDVFFPQWNTAEWKEVYREEKGEFDFVRFKKQ